MRTLEVVEAIVLGALEVATEPPAAAAVVTEAEPALAAEPAVAAEAEPTGVAAVGTASDGRVSGAARPARGC